MKRKNISLLLAVVLVLSCFSGCAAQKAAVTAALRNSAVAFKDAADTVLPEESFSPADGYSQETELSLSALPGELSFLNGCVSLRIEGASANDDCRESRFEMKLGSLSLFSVAARTEGRFCTLTSGEHAMLINMDTLQEDLDHMGLGSLLDTEGPGLSALGAAAPSPDFVLTEKEEDELKDALAAMVLDIDVKNAGSEKRDINGQEKKCHIYAVTFPSKDLCRLWDAAAPALLRALRDAPLPGTEDEDPEELLSDLRDALVSSGDWEMEMAVCDKLVMSVSAEVKGKFRSDEFDLNPTLTVGGGEEYVDDITLRVTRGDDVTLEWRSHGDHGGRKGAFTDESTVTRSDKDERIATSVRYAAGEKRDNLRLELDAADTALTLTGTLRSTAEEISLTDGKVVLEGDTDTELAVESRMSAYRELVPPNENAVPLSETDWTEIYNFLGGFLEKLDGLSDLFDAA